MSTIIAVWIGFCFAGGAIAVLEERRGSFITAVVIGIIPISVRIFI